MTYLGVFLLGAIAVSVVWYILHRSMEEMYRAADEHLTQANRDYAALSLRLHEETDKHMEWIMAMRQAGFTEGGATQPPPRSQPMIPTDIEQFIAKLEPGVAQVTRALVYERLEEGQGGEHILNELLASTMDIEELING